MSRWAIEQDYQQFKDELGLDHYEGRGWIGWRHHLTLIMLAHAFLTLETRRRKTTRGGPCPQTRRELQYLLCTWTGICAYCRATIPRSRGS
jgi:SRSO17 transposase